MRKRLIKKVRQILPYKMVRREQFANRIRNRKRHSRKYNMYTYKSHAKVSRFNRWQDYKRLNNRFF